MAVLRFFAVAVLILLLWNPVRVREESADDPIVLVDHSLSVSPAVIDTARRIAGGGRPLLLFGDQVEPFDSSRERMGASHLTAALVQAAARGGGAIVVTDGEIDDIGDVPPDLLQRAGVVLVPRDTVPSAALLDVRIPAAVSRSDTVTAALVIGAWGDGLPRTSSVVIRSRGQLITRSTVTLPDPGASRRAQITFPASALGDGFQPVDFLLEPGPADREARDDGRTRLIHVSELPAVVVVASVPGWETRFLTTALHDLLQAPVRAFVQSEPGIWRDASSLAPVAASEVQVDARSAALVVWHGESGGAATRYRPSRGTLLSWALDATISVEGDWYVAQPEASPLAGRLAGVRWDSLPPLASLVPQTVPAGAWVGLEARLLRRGAARPVVIGRDSAGVREVDVTASGLWRWALRGGSTLEAYRTIVSATVDWLLGEQGLRRDRIRPVASVVTRGHAVIFERADSTLETGVITLRSAESARVDTLVFDSDGRAEIGLTAGVYGYEFEDEYGSGMVIVEDYSDEFRPRPVVVEARAQGLRVTVLQEALRDRGWLFAVVLALLVAEWAWRRQRGLP